MHAITGARFLIMIALAAFASLAGAAGSPPGAAPSDAQAIDSPREMRAGTVGFVALPGWRVVNVVKAGNEADGTTMLLREPQPPGGCALFVTPVVSDPSDAATFGVTFVNALLPAELKPFGARGISRYDGVSGRGWRYVDLYAEVGDPKAHMAAHVLVADLGPQKVAMVGITSSTIDINPYALAPQPVPVCLAGQDNDDWVVLFHTLQIPGHEKDDPALSRQLIGSWSHMGTVALALTFGPNGEYSHGGATGYTLNHVHPGKSEEHITTVAGDAHYLVQGDRLYTTCTPKCDMKKFEFFSVVRHVDAKTPAGSWMLRFIQMRQDGPGRVGYMTLNYNRDP